ANRDRECRPWMVAHHLNDVQLLLELVDRRRHALASQLDVAADVSCRLSHSLSSLSVAMVSSGTSDVGDNCRIARFVIANAAAAASIRSRSAASQYESRGTH